MHGKRLRHNDSPFRPWRKKRRRNINHIAPMPIAKASSDSCPHARMTVRIIAEGGARRATLALVTPSSAHNVWLSTSIMHQEKTLIGHLLTDSYYLDMPTGSPPTCHNSLVSACGPQLRGRRNATSVFNLNMPPCLWKLSTFDCNSVRPVIHD